MSLATPVTADKLPRMTRNTTSNATAGAFPDKQPIGVDRTGRAVFLYLVLPSARDDFRGFLGRHRELLVCLPSWTLRLVFLRQYAHVYEAYQAVVREEWESPLHPRTVEELTWFFERWREMNGRVQPGSDERLERAAQAFERPRFYRLYGRWLRGGDQTLVDLTSTTISDALAAGRGRVESLILPHRYDHLSPLVNMVGSPSRDDRPEATSSLLRRGALRADTGGAPHLHLPLNPAFHESRIEQHEPHKRRVGFDHIRQHLSDSGGDDRIMQ
jgi:hypothetical protein